MTLLAKSPPLAREESEVAAPVRLGAGSFATVYAISGGPVAYKRVHNIDEASTLQDEYEMLDKIYWCCNTDYSFFGIPRALAYNNPLVEPDDGGFITTDTAASSPFCKLKPRRRSDRPTVTRKLMSVFDAPTYAMDRVHALPWDVRVFLKDKFFPPAVQVGPALCRLYFGKTLSNDTPKFVNSSNFPLDVHRYGVLRTYMPELPPAEEVAEGMGEMLGWMHNRAGADARDVEFVLGGDGAGGYTFFVIDFNQVRKWSKCVEDVVDLVQPFFVNDPYYPRPRPNDPLYQAFRSGYLEQYGTHTRSIGIAFLDAIEREQASRDQRSWW
ncbi:hypothetical protein L226DRAFT_324399 [Lentinus tigrinus ALCF2SS1-7]|uniref:DUF3669 domain-containing protein n=1 Tax=Lentinus tigrinus ALCF2SS1-6 TaxID=1328759 RepID=A0A5C2SML3_9APHY|nr:hypothetical protein L227DRAFT_573244 [Lentinus tigrinus ALCF2SS1-6]RPD77510.1 hypothetical protein L226DRAFT_324399 [Lentinus tigrinus ALCF2SS1-7]